MRQNNSIGIAECARAWKDFEIPGPRPHPCVFFNTAEIEEIRRLAQIEGTRQYREKQKILAAAAVLQVATRDSQERFIANYGDAALTAQELYYMGEFAAVSTRQGRVDWVMFVNGVRLVHGDFVLTAAAPGIFVAALSASGEWQATTPAGEAMAISVQPGGTRG